MVSRRNKLYTFLVIACAAGYCWLFYNRGTNPSGDASGTSVCIIKHVTDIPCPSCGSTRSIMSLVHGDILHSILINPFGLLVALLMVVIPPWVTIDLFLQKDSLLKFYHSSERAIRNPRVAVPLILLVVVNWAWNIMKGL